MAKDIGVGVIGIGMGENMLALNEDTSSRFEVRGLCARTKSKAEALAHKWNIPIATTDYWEIIDCKDIDVVGIYSPDHLHGEHAISALKAGKHVVCTKPMVTKMEDCEEIVRLVGETGLKFLVGQTMRFDPEFVNAKRMYDDGDLGEIIMAEAHYVHDLRDVADFTPWRVEAPQDLMFGGACHPIDVLRWLLGDIEEVHVYARKSDLIPQYPIEENFLINLKFKNGVIGRIMAAYGIVHPPMPMMGLGLYGTKGSLISDYTDFRGGHIKVVLDKMQGLPEASMSFEPIMEGAYGHGKAVKQYMAHFEDCLINDKQPSPDCRDGAKSISTGIAGWESARTGKPVKVRNEF